MVLNTILFFVLTCLGLALLTMGLQGLLGYTKKGLLEGGKPDYAWGLALAWTLVGAACCLVAVLITAPRGIAAGTMLAFGIAALVAAGRVVWFVVKGKEVSRQEISAYAKVNAVVYVMLWLFSLWIFVVKPYTWFTVGGTQSAF